MLARQKVLESLLVNVTSSAGLADRLAYLARFELSDDYFDMVANAVSQLTLPQLHAFLVTELAADKQVVGAFGNAKPAEAAIDAARAAAKSSR